MGNEGYFIIPDGKKKKEMYQFQREKKMKSILSMQKQRDKSDNLGDEDNDTQWPKRTVDV